jgi:hypothetical protein
MDSDMDIDYDAGAATVDSGVQQHANAQVRQYQRAQD